MTPLGLTRKISVYLRDLGYPTEIGEYSWGERWVRVFSRATNLRRERAAIDAFMANRKYTIKKPYAYEQIGLVIIKPDLHWFVDPDSSAELHAVMEESFL